MSRLFYFCLLILVASSCSLTSNLAEVEVLVPGRNNLELASDDRIMFVVDYKPNRRAVQNTTSAFIDDSLLVTATANSVVSNFRELGNYSQNFVTVRGRLTHEKEAQDLTAEEVEKYSILEQPRYIINLALFRILIKPFENNDIAYNATSVSLWRVYDAETGKLAHEMLSRDSMMFFKGPNTTREHLDSTIMNDMSLIVADKIAANYFPTWQQQSRYYMLVSDLDFYKVKILIETFNWNDVINLMKPYVSVPDKNTVFAASYNLALACEMNGRIDLAIKWLNNAEKYRKNSATQQYRRLLEEREKDLSNLPI